MLDLKVTQIPLHVLQVLEKEDTTMLTVVFVHCALKKSDAAMAVHEEREREDDESASTAITSAKYISLHLLLGTHLNTSLQIVLWKNNYRGESRRYAIHQEPGPQILSIEVGSSRTSTCTYYLPIHKNEPFFKTACVTLALCGNAEVRWLLQKPPPAVSSVNRLKIARLLHRPLEEHVLEF
ncbi:hypothetical protein PsorP6_011454 [Peronosclerospora sorghi]|uniref:Uncharacterized protein n=1 Tax=Peronosclerospora sorghi TaxID=230839 RepID=A0ACC0WMF2_9STRA|nr:hypothetical protein PsorP6_011454 [Peronosclerospora sorghi]